MTYKPTKTTGKYFSLTVTVESWRLLLSQKYGRSLRMLLPTIPNGWLLLVARWVNQLLTVLCYQSQTSKFLRKNRRNPNLKQNSESSFKSRVRICRYADKAVAAPSPGPGIGLSWPICTDNKRFSV